MKMVYGLLTVLTFSCTSTYTASAHGGGMDGYGGHNNRKAGNYHFHKGPLAGRAFDSKAEAIRALNRIRKKESEPAPSTRFGPKAGTALDGPSLLGIRIAPEVRITPYDRDDYAYPQSIEISIIARQGGIFSPYTLRCFDNRGETDIEHIVAVSEAHESGMSRRTDAERRAFGNDLDNLTLAAPRLNRYRKGAKDPAEWLPDKNRCWYVAKYIEIKKKYGLTMDPAEASAIQKVYESCESFGMIKPDCNRASSREGKPTTEERRRWRQ